TKAGAMLESSKVFAKQFMLESGIPTARGEAFHDPEKAKDYVRSLDASLVVKADGLAAGKGVIVCDKPYETMEAIDRIMVRKEHGNAGSRIVIEERIFGEEASFIALCDGKTAIPLASSQDHKRALDGDKGPNTGGMGAYSPAPIVTSEMGTELMK